MVVLPEPDSPTRLKVSPAARSKETPWITRVVLTATARERDLEVFDLEDRVSARRSGGRGASVTILHQFDACGMSAAVRGCTAAAATAKI